MEKNDKKKKLLWSILFLLIAAMTVWALTSQNKAFSLHSFATYWRTANKGWLVCGLLAAFGFIAFEGAALAAACRPFGRRIRLTHAYLYAAADVYFSAITPSATGGQPASAYFMVKDGMAAGVTAAVLLANLMMYTLSIVVIGVIIFFAFPGVFLHYGLVGKLLIVFGCAAQLAMVVFFGLLLKDEKLLKRIADWGLHFLCRLHILRHEVQKREKLNTAMDTYREQLLCLHGQRKMFIFVFLFNFLQRASSISVTLFVYLAGGGTFADGLRVWATQGFAVLGSNSIPIPGAMGVSDYLMLEGFGMMMPAAEAANLELLSRGLSFYLCITVCGISVLLGYFLQKRRNHHAGIL